MSEEANKAAHARRSPHKATETAFAEFSKATDHFSTCQKCGNSVGVISVGGAWVFKEHACD